MNEVRVLPGERVFCSKECRHFDLLPNDDTYSFCRLHAKSLSWEFTQPETEEQRKSGLTPSAPVRSQACLDDPDVSESTRLAPSCLPAQAAQG